MYTRLYVCVHVYTCSSRDDYKLYQVKRPCWKNYLTVNIFLSKQNISDLNKEQTFILYNYQMLLIDTHHYNHYVYFEIASRHITL